MILKVLIDWIQNYLISLNNYIVLLNLLRKNSNQFVAWLRLSSSNSGVPMSSNLIASPFRQEYGEGCRYEIKANQISVQLTNLKEKLIELPYKYYLNISGIFVCVYVIFFQGLSVHLFCDDSAFAFGWSMALFMDQPSTKNAWRVFAAVFLLIKNYFITVFSVINFQFLIINSIQTVLEYLIWGYWEL